YVRVVAKSLWAGLRGVACDSRSTAGLELSQCSQRAVRQQAALLIDFLKFGDVVSPLVQRKVRDTRIATRLGHRRSIQGGSKPNFFSKLLPQFAPPLLFIVIMRQQGFVQTKPMSLRIGGDVSRRFQKFYKQV